MKHDRKNDADRKKRANVGKAHALPANQARSQTPRTRGASFRQTRQLRDQKQSLQKRVTIEDVLKYTDRCEPTGPQEWKACCPAHADSNPSLSIADRDDKLLLTCHAGCDFKEIVSAIQKRRLEDQEQKVTRQPPKLSGPMTARRKPIQAPQRKANANDLVTADDASEDWALKVVAFENNLHPFTLAELAKQLGVSEGSLKKLRIGWTGSVWPKRAYTFPEFNALREVVGISTRKVDGKKGFLGGGHRGLYLPVDWCRGDGPLLICEGASDTASALTMGLAVVGRPSSKGGAELLSELLREFPRERPIIVVSENDEKQNGRWPGKEGAEAIAKELSSQLGRGVRVGMLPKQVKDIRDYLRAESSRSLQKEDKCNG